MFKQFPYTLILFYPLSVSVTAQSKTCYYKDGTEAVNDNACHPNNDISFCCGPGYACLDSRVCQKTIDSLDSNNFTYARGSCTDSSWSSTACPQFCTGIEYNDGGGNLMGLCSQSNSIWCCASNQVTCDCNTGENTITLTRELNAFTTIGQAVTLTSTSNTSSTTTIAASSSSTASQTTNLPLSTSPSTSISTPIAASTAAPSAIASPAPTSTPLGLSTAAEIGLGIGISLGIAVSALIASLFWRTQTQNKRLEALDRENIKIGAYGGSFNQGTGGGYGSGSRTGMPPLNETEAGGVYEMSYASAIHTAKEAAVYEMPHGSLR